jgi:hypothetical protein
MDLASAAPGAYDAGAAQFTKVPGNERLAKPQYAGEFGHGDLVLVGEVVNDGETRYIREGFHHYLEFTPVVHFSSWWRRIQAII